MVKSDISIHAPREGGDSAHGLYLLPVCYFNPRPPRGGRLFCTRISADGVQFQSTPPARGATAVFNYDYGFQDISIHAPREGGDPSRPTFTGKPCTFQSTPPPRGGRRGALFWRMVKSDISIHAPREGGDPGHFPWGGTPWTISIHAPREGGDYGHQRAGVHRLISIHAPREGGDADAVQKRQGQFGISIHAPREGGDLFQILHRLD